MNLPAEGWEVFYENDHYSSLNSEWVDLPDGVLIVIIWHGYHIPGVRKKTIMSGQDYYYFHDSETWGATNDFSLVKDLPFKRGIWVTDEKMEDTQRFVFEKLDNG